MSTQFALVSNSTGLVQTFVGPGIPEHWTPPEGYSLLSADQLPEGWQREQTTPEPPRELVKITIRRRLRAMGKEAAFDAALNAIPNARADWDDAHTIRTDDPMFTTHAIALKAAVGLTDEQFTHIISP